MRRNKKQTVYLPTSDSNTRLQVGSMDNNDYYKSFSKERDVEEAEGFFFTEEQLKEFLTDYTNKIVECVKLKCNYYNEDDNKELFDEHKDHWTCREDRDGITYGVDVYEVSKESITNELPKFLNEIL